LRQRNAVKMKFFFERNAYTIPQPSADT
jgi:hypothetical protein